jgi:ankyrin repeat protein
LANLADPFDYYTHVNQLILAKQLVEHGANVNTVAKLVGMTPFHRACFSGNVTNLDFIEYLLEAGADPNAQDHKGHTPFMYTTPDTPSAAKFLLNWPTTDANITSRSGENFQNKVRRTIMALSDEVALPNNPRRVQDQFVL